MFQAAQRIRVHQPSKRDTHHDRTHHDSPCLVCLQVRGRLRPWKPLKEFGPERVRVLRGRGLEGPGVGPTLAVTQATPDWLAGLHPGIRYTEGQGLLLWALQQSLWSLWLGLERAFLLGEGDVLIFRGARGAGVCVPRGAGLGGTLRAVVRAAANVDNAGDIDLGPVATRRCLC